MLSYDEFYPRKSKPEIDAIDKILAEYLGLSADELDFIINFDIKFRMGLASTDDDEIDEAED